LPRKFEAYLLRAGFIIANFRRATHHSSPEHRKLPLVETLTDGAEVPDAALRTGRVIDLATGVDMLSEVAKEFAL
jgi:hypothetical protein